MPNPVRRIALSVVLCSSFNAKMSSGYDKSARITASMLISFAVQLNLKDADWFLSTKTYQNNYDWSFFKMDEQEFRLEISMTQLK